MHGTDLSHYQLFAGLIHLPIVEKAIERTQPA